MKYFVISVCCVDIAGFDKLLDMLAKLGLKVGCGIDRVKSHVHNMCVIVYACILGVLHGPVQQKKGTRCWTKNEVWREDS